MSRLLLSGAMVLLTVIGCSPGEKISLSHSFSVTVENGVTMDEAGYFYTGMMR